MNNNEEDMNDICACVCKSSLILESTDDKEWMCYLIYKA